MNLDSHIALMVDVGIDVNNRPRFDQHDVMGKAPAIMTLPYMIGSFEWAWVAGPGDPGTRPCGIPPLPQGSITAN